MLSSCQLITSDMAKQTVAFCYSRYLQRFIIFQLISLPSLIAHGPPCLMVRLVSSHNLSKELKATSKADGPFVADGNTHHFWAWTCSLFRPTPGVDTVTSLWTDGGGKGRWCPGRWHHLGVPQGHMGTQVLEKLALCTQYSWLLPHLSNRVAERLYKFLLSCGDYLCQLFWCQKQFFLMLHLCRKCPA